MQTCNGCGASIESRYAFCWKCGSAMNDEHHSSTPAPRKPPTLLAQAMDLDDELTVQTEPRPLNSTMFSWTTSQTPERTGSTSRGSVLKLIAIAAVALALVSLGLFGLLRSSTQTASATVETPPPVQQQASQPQPTPPVTTEVSRSAPAETTTQQVVSANPDDELKKLREKGMTAKPSESSGMTCSC